MIVNNSKSGRQMLAAASFICVLSVFSGVMSAQTPLDNAWTILQAGTENKSIDERVITMRVLQLIPGDARAVSMAQKGLQDKEAQVRVAAAASLGAMEDKSAVPQLAAMMKSEPEGEVVMALAKALIQLGDQRGYEVFYAVVTGTRKSGESLIGGEEKELTQLLKNPHEMEKIAFEQGIGFVPFGGVSMEAFQIIHANKEQAPIMKASSIKALAKDPDPRTVKALLAALSDKNWLVRSAAYDALARRGDAAVLPEISTGLTDEKAEVKFTAAAAVAHLSRISNKAAGE